MNENSSLKKKLIITTTCMDWIYRNEMNMEFSSYGCKIKTIFKEEGETILEGPRGIGEV